MSAALKAVGEYLSKNAEKEARVNELMPVVVGADIVTLKLLSTVCSVGMLFDRPRFLEFMGNYQRRNPTPMEFRGMVREYLLESSMDDLRWVERNLGRLNSWLNALKAVCSELGIPHSSEQLVWVAGMIASDEQYKIVPVLYWMTFGDYKAKVRFIPVKEYGQHLQDDKVTTVEKFLDHIQNTIVNHRDLSKEIAEYRAANC